RQALVRVVAVERALRDATQAKLDDLLARRATIESELTGAAGEREAALSVSYELRSLAARLAVQRESATRMIARLDAELAEAEADAARGGPSPEELEQQALFARAAARDAAHERDTLAERALTAQERLATLERSLAEREGIPPAARALARRDRARRRACGRSRPRPARVRGRGADGEGRARAARARGRVGPRAAPRPRRPRPARARRRAAGGGAGRAPRVEGPGRHARRVRLRPGARRALVRRRDRGGRPPRARVEARCARG